MRHPRNSLFACLILLAFLMGGIVFYSQQRARAPQVALPVITPAPTPVRGSPVLHDIDAPFDWYLWEGYRYGDSFEPAAAANCGPAVVAMALQYASNNQLQLRPEAVRTWMPGKQGTTQGTIDQDLTAALDAWGVPWQFVDSIDAIATAVTKNHLVLLPIAMQAVTLEEAQTHPVQTADGETISGRFNSYVGGHWLVIKGLAQDSTTGQTYFVVYDPNVWEGNPSYYYRGEARYPKGLNRLYAYTEIEHGYRAVAPNQAIEILASPWEPALAPSAQTIDPSSKQEEKGASVAFWCSKRRTDLAGVQACSGDNDF